MDLNKTQWEKILSIVLSAVLAIMAVGGWIIQPLLVEEPAPIAVLPQSLTGYAGDFGDIYADSLVTGGNITAVDGDYSGDMTVAGTFGGTGLGTFGAGVTLADGDAVIADDARITAQTSIAVTNGAAFTATGTYQPIVAAAEVTPTVTVGTAGDVLILINTGSDVVNLVDTGTTMLSAAWAGGQYDSLTLFADGTNWIEISRSDN